MSLLKAAALCVLIGIASLPPAYAQNLVVGGKNFTEQLLVAEMTAQLLSAKGYEIDKRTGFSTSGIRRQHELGLIDVYWEYTGTSLVTFNNILDKLGPEDAYSRVKALDERKGLIWLSPSKVNNTYALAMRKADAAFHGIRTISDLAAKLREGRQLKLACNTEFYIRSDGLMPLQRVYGFEFGRENVIRMNTEAVYDVLRDSAAVDVGLVFATDGRVAALDLLILEDDRGFFPSYLLTPVVRRSTLERHPDLATYLEALSQKLDNAAIASLNAMIDIHGQTTGEVAASFLRANGLM